jgi:hypothetical protein
LIPIWTLESLDAEVVDPAAPAATDLLSVLKERCPVEIQDTFFLSLPLIIGGL